MSSDSEKEKAALVPTASKAMGETSSSLLPDGWRGNDHLNAVKSAQEAGLDPRKTELDLFQSAFASSLVLDDPGDHAIVVFGRTTLSDLEFLRCLRPTLRFLRLREGDVVVRIHDGEFEMRVHAAAAEAAPASLEHAKIALQVLLGAGLFGWMAMQIAQWATALVWGVGLLFAAWLLRRGLVSGRALLGARLATSLAMVAQEEGLILPPAGAGALTTK